MKKVVWLGRVFSVFLYILVLVFGVSIAAVLLFGLKLYCIQTGSMEPEYPVGMMIVVEPVSFDLLETGDVITFAKDSSTVVTHRIVEIDREQQLITTKGDNNNVQDGAPVSYRNVVGRVKFGVRGVGYFILILNTNFGKWMLAIVMVALIGIEVIRRMYYHDKFEEETEDAQTDEQDAELMQWEEWWYISRKAKAELKEEETKDMPVGAKVFDVAFTVFVYLLSAVILIAALMFASNTSPDKSLFGYRYYTILTGSMEPTYSVGDMIFVKLADAKEINVGDVITFNPSQDSDAYLTHRVTEKLEDFEGTGVTCFRTQGDANNAEDSFLIDSSRVVGVVKFSLARVGYIVRFVQLRWYLVVPVVIMIAVLFRLLKRYFLIGKDEEETAEETPKKKGEKAENKVDSDTESDSGTAETEQKPEPQPEPAMKAEEANPEKESNEGVSENKGS